MKTPTKPSSTQRIPESILDASGERINIFAWKAANIRYSWLLFAGIFGLFVAIGYLAAVATDTDNVLFIMGISVVVAAFLIFISLQNSDSFALSMSGAREATPEEHRYLVNVSEAVAIGAGIPMPKVYVIDSPAPNAFATGRNPENSSIAVTKGLLELLDRQELEGVVAHEIAHIHNYDVRFITLVAATVGALVLLRDAMIRPGYGRYGRGRRRGGMMTMGSPMGGSRSRGSSDKGKGSGQIIAGILLLVLIILAPILARLAQMMISRRREYLADATAAYITRNPEGLARALEKLRDYQGEPLQASEGLRAMFFSDPVLQASGLFATHPPLQERINFLRRL